MLSINRKHCNNQFCAAFFFFFFLIPSAKALWVGIRNQPKDLTIHKLYELKTISRLLSNDIMPTNISLMMSSILTNTVTNQIHFSSKLTGRSLKLIAYLGP